MRESPSELLNGTVSVSGRLVAGSSESAPRMGLLHGHLGASGARSQGARDVKRSLED